MSKKRILVFFSFCGALLWQVPAWASLSAGDQIFSDGAAIEVTDIRSCGASSQQDFGRFSMLAKVSCSTKQELEGFLSVTRITTGIVEIGAACSAVGAPVVVAAGVTGLATEMIDLVVSNLDCEDPSDTQKVDELVKRRVCSALTQKGFECDPERL